MVKSPFQFLFGSVSMFVIDFLTQGADVCHENQGQVQGKCHHTAQKEPWE
jgi:hypothetical protein